MALWEKRKRSFLFWKPMREIQVLTALDRWIPYRCIHSTGVLGRRLDLLRNNARGHSKRFPVCMAAINVAISLHRIILFSDRLCIVYTMSSCGRRP